MASIFATGSHRPGRWFIQLDLLLGLEWQVGTGTCPKDNALSFGLGRQAVGRLASAQRKQTSRSCQAHDTTIRRLIAVNENQGVKE